MSDFQYDTYRRWRDEDEDLERKKRGAMLDRIRDLATGPESTLPKTNAIIQNYNLRKLSSLNKTQVGLVRAARFNNGVFLSFRMEHTGSLLQTDLSFERDDRPGILTWPLLLDGSIIKRAGMPTDRDQDMRLRHTLTTLVGQALGILEHEAAADTPWSHRFSSVEVASVRHRSGILYETRHVRPDEFGISPKDGEPYL